MSAGPASARLRVSAKITSRRRGARNARETLKLNVGRRRRTRDESERCVVTNLVLHCANRIGKRGDDAWGSEYANMKIGAPRGPSPGPPASAIVSVSAMAAAHVCKRRRRPVAAANARRVCRPRLPITFGSHRRGSHRRGIPAGTASTANACRLHAARTASRAFSLCASRTVVASAGDLPAFVEASPATYIDHVVTPLLLLHGEQGLRCPLTIMCGRRYGKQKAKARRRSRDRTSRSNCRQ